MAPEDLHFDRKSLRTVTGKNPAWAELALDCVAFANAQGGRLLIGIEDGFDAPPPGQIIPPGLTEAVVKRLRELTVNVGLAANITSAANGAESLTLLVARAHGVASTSDGRYAIRIGDECKPVVGDDWTACSRASNLVRAVSIPRPESQSPHRHCVFSGQSGHR